MGNIFNNTNVELANIIRGIEGEKQKIAAAQQKLGEVYLDRHRDDAEEEFKPIIGEITDAETKISELEKQSRKLRNVVLCEECGAEVPAGDRFCVDCGAKLPEPEKTEESNVCAKCGKPIMGDARFCIYCGAPIEKKTGEPKPEKNVKKCAKCGFETEDMSMNFCENCGSRFDEGEQNEPEQAPSKTCPNCGYKTDDMSKKFCIECGTALV